MLLTRCRKEPHSVRAQNKEVQLVPFFPSFFPSGHFNLVGVMVPSGDPENNCNKKFLEWFKYSNVIPMS